MKQKLKWMAAALLLASSVGMVQPVLAESYITNVVCYFTNFNLSVFYGSWEPTNGGVTTSGANGYEVVATNYGSGAYFLPTPIDVPGATKAQLTFTLNSPSGTYKMGPNFDLTSDGTNQVQYLEYANYTGGHTYTVTATNLGTLNPANITAFNLEMDPSGYGYTKPYDITYKLLVLLTPGSGSRALPVVTWANPAYIHYGTALSSNQLNATATFGGNPLPGSFAYNPPSGTVLNTGNNPLSVVFTPMDTNDFQSVTDAVSIIVLPPGPKPVMAEYQPWFQSPYSLGPGNWGGHWTGSFSTSDPFMYFDPNDTNSEGQDEIASHFYPLIGPYDSADPVVLEYHVLLMKLAGIDGVIVDWYGPDDYYDYSINNQRTLDLLGYIRNAGLKFSLCYESSTISAEIRGGCQNGVCVTSNNAISHAQQTMLYAQTNFFDDPTFLRLNGQPVLLTFGEPTYFVTSSNWQSVFSVLDATNQPAFFTEDGRIAPVAMGGFDWPPMGLSTPTGGSNVLSDSAMEGYLNTFDANGEAWPAFVTTAFPRFYDIYAQEGGTSDGYLSDNNGVTFQETLSRAMTNSGAVIQLATWNDFGEGTIIEPTSQYGYRDLGVIQNYRRQYLDPAFPYTTNDLTIALRLYNLRRQYAGNPVINAELNRAFTNAAYGNLPTANLQLTGIESNYLVLYNLSVNTNGLLEFSVGGALPTGSTAILASANLVGATWQTVATLPGGTDLLTFSTNIFSSGIPMFFKAQSGP